MPRELGSLDLLLIRWDERLTAVEQRQLRFMRAWIASHMNSSISGKTDKTSHTSTAVGPAPNTKLPLWRRTAKYLRPILTFILERIAPWLWGILAPFLFGLWAWGREGAEKAWNSLLGAWLWFAG